MFRILVGWICLAVQASNAVASSSHDNHCQADDEHMSLLQTTFRSITHGSRSSDAPADKQNFNVSSIPCHIHQTWKTNKWEELPSWVQSSVTSFKLQNPGCDHTLWSDDEMNAFMAKEYPQLQEGFLALRPVERADLFRYAVVHTKGGFYADADVECTKPIKEWGLPAEAELAIGYETGFHLTEKERKQMEFGRNEQFNQWMFGAVPGHPALKRCLDLFEEKREWGLEDTIELTGPSLFSDSVHEFLWRYGRPAHHDATTDTAHFLSYPPGQGPAGSKAWIFSANQVSAPGFSAGDIGPSLLVKHHFKGTWRDAPPR